MLTNRQTEILINSICERFLYRDDQLICNDFMKHNAHFLLNILYSTNDSKEAVLIHPGVDRLLPLAILVLSILSIVDADKIDVADFFAQFQVGDMVVRNGTRYHYNGTDNTYCYLLSDDTRGVGHAIAFLSTLQSVAVLRSVLIASAACDCSGEYKSLMVERSNSGVQNRTGLVGFF